VPTPYGRALIKRGIAIFDELKQGIREIELLADPTAGEVRIAAPMALATGFVAAAIDRFARKYPRIVCHLVVDRVEQAYRTLEERNADLVIAFINTPIAEDHMEAEMLYVESQFVVAATRNPWSRRRSVRLDDLMQEPWALPPPDSVLGAGHAHIFRASGLDPPAATVLCTSGVARMGLVAAGQFLTIASETVLKFVGRDMAIKALPINLPKTQRWIGIITLKNRTLTPVAQRFIDCARELARPLATGKAVSTRRRRAPGT
jgi:DNA-binding transcriptional LysR family regulator